MGKERSSQDNLRLSINLQTAFSFFNVQTESLFVVRFADEGDLVRRDSVFSDGAAAANAAC